MENETFEDIAESDLPIIGDISSSNTPQSQSISQGKASDQEEVPSIIVEKASNINESGTPVTMIVESTGDESQSSLLGENSPSANEVAMEQEADATGKTNTSEESQDSMAEIRQILSTPVVINASNSDVDMSQQEQENNEQEVTITAIIEELNRSISSKGNSSTQEGPLEDSKVEILTSEH